MVHCIEKVPAKALHASPEGRFSPTAPKTRPRPEAIYTAAGTPYVGLQ